MARIDNTARNQKWLNLYLTGTSIAAIANLYGCTFNNVYHGIKTIAPAAIAARGRKHKKAEAVTQGEFKSVIMHGKIHVLRFYRRMGSQLPQPNYIGSGMALCGVLRDGETLQEWISRNQTKLNKAG